ncbi:hypothetical protein FH972_024178 [Carpinus fangiana]|uniref:Uncharacterized protein n=1 Tax=Carpinus fangiana TaxID=176857 RepID=A0A5N6KXK7_9ROSI|nr:hypothetical protein FH972_024178 [Carpinus fangiana]
MPTAVLKERLGAAATRFSLFSYPFAFRIPLPKMPFRDQSNHSTDQQDQRLEETAETNGKSCSCIHTRQTRSRYPVPPNFVDPSQLNIFHSVFDAPTAPFTEGTSTPIHQPTPPILHRMPLPYGCDPPLTFKDIDYNAGATSISTVHDGHEVPYSCPVNPESNENVAQAGFQLLDHGISDGLDPHHGLLQQLPAATRAIPDADYAAAMLPFSSVNWPLAQDVRHDQHHGEDAQGSVQDYFCFSENPLLANFPFPNHDAIADESQASVQVSSTDLFSPSYYRSSLDQLIVLQRDVSSNEIPRFGLELYSLMTQHLDIRYPEIVTFLCMSPPNANDYLTLFEANHASAQPWIEDYRSRILAIALRTGYTAESFVNAVCHEYQEIARMNGMLDVVPAIVNVSEAHSNSRDVVIQTHAERFNVHCPPAKVIEYLNDCASIPCRARLVTHLHMKFPRGDACQRGDSLAGSFEDMTALRRHIETWDPSALWWCPDHEEEFYHRFNRLADHLDWKHGISLTPKTAEWKAARNRYQVYDGKKERTCPRCNQALDVSWEVFYEHCRKADCEG